MALMITGVAIFVCLFSQSLWAFVAGDKVKLSVNPKLGPYTIENCQTEEAQTFCKLKEAGYSVNATFLKKHDPTVKLANSANADDGSAVSVQVMGR